MVYSDTRRIALRNHARTETRRGKKMRGLKLGRSMLLTVVGLVAMAGKAQAAGPDPIGPPSVVAAAAPPLPAGWMETGYFPSARRSFDASPMEAAAKAVRDSPESCA